jgi:hypothetical protein
MVLVLINQLGQPYLRGFFCDDTTIVYPYKQNTVTSDMLYGVGISLPLVSVCMRNVGRAELTTERRPPSFTL